VGETWGEGLSIGSEAWAAAERVVGVLVSFGCGCWGEDGVYRFVELLDRGMYPVHQDLPQQKRASRRPCQAGCLPSVCSA
jgi:hypothetical protein